MKITGDILDQILTRLPVKSLVRFKVVCKEWYYNIQSDFFIAKRITNQTTKALIYHNQRGGRNLLVSICSELEKNDEDDDTGLTLFHQDQQYSIQEMPLDYLRYYEPNIKPDDYYDGDHPANMFRLLHYHQIYYIKSMPLHYLKYYCDDVQVVGTCNGLVCLDYTDWNKDEIAYNRIITLWNPATRDFKTLPSREPQRHTRQLALRNLRARDHIGFGFDCTSNDYKVLRVVYRLEKNSVDQAMIYSLNTNSWKELDYSNVSAKIRFISRCGSTIFLCEKVYWVILSHDAVGNQVLLSFDMGKEVFQLTPLPSEFKPLVKQSIEFLNTELFTLHDSVALVRHRETLQIWTTKELEQGRASWTKVLNIDHVTGIARPLGFWKCKSSSHYLFLFIHFNYGKTDSDRNMNAMKGIYINNQGEIKDDKVMTIKVEDNIVLPLKIASYVETLVPVNRP